MMEPQLDSTTNESTTPEGQHLDPQNWTDFSQSMHDLLDVCLNRMENAHKHPWRPVPGNLASRVALDGSASGTQSVFSQVEDSIMPYATGNTHPRFWGWVHGTGVPVAVGAEMVAATMNSNCGGRDHGAPHVEASVLKWIREVAGMPIESSSGILTGGTSQATLIALNVARFKRFGTKIRTHGLLSLPPIRVYVAQGGHSCIQKALEILGHGSNCLVKIPLNENYQMDINRLKDQIELDRAEGFCPLAVVGTAGSVNMGAYDDLIGLSELAKEENLWLHVDAAFGFWIRLAKRPYCHLTAGIGRSDSIALDLHKWIGVPYACGACLLADKENHRAAFTTRPDYLAPGSHGGLAGGDLWFCDYGLDLSRGFSALKVWVTIKTLGREAFSKVITDNCCQASLLGRLVEDSGDLTLASPVISNVCCFHVPGGNEAKIAAQLQMDGVAVFSTTKIDGRLCLRAAIVNHRTTSEDIQAAFQGVLKLVELGENAPSTKTSQLLVRTEDSVPQ